jgi:tetratricopeptide (TPR) repeat protein
MTDAALQKVRLISVMRRFLREALFSFLALLLLSITVSEASAEGTDGLNDATRELIRQGEYDKALDQLKEAFSLFPYNESIRKNLTATYAAVGKKKLERKEFDAAAENFDNARKLNPAIQEYGMLRGIALCLGKHYDAAAIELEQSRQNGGDNVPLLYYLGRVYYESGDLDKALEAWDGALAIEPGNKPIRDIAEKARRESAVESRMEKGYSSMFVISYDEGTRSDLADAVLDALESAYNRVGYDLSYYPATRVPVILYNKKDYRAVTAGPEWSGGLYDGKVRLPIGGAREITPVLRGVLSHEYTHVVVGELTKGNCPTWLNEGLAEVEGRKEFNPAMPELAGAAKTGAFFSFNALGKSLSSLKTKDAILAYQQSYSMVNFMISAYGWHKVRETLVNLGAGMRFEAAIAGAFADFGLDFAAIVKEWQEHMRKEYGGG